MLSRAVTALRLDTQRQAQADHDERDKHAGRCHRQSPPEAQADEDRHEHGCQDRAEPEQGVEDQDRAVDGARVKGGGERVQRGHAEAEARAEKGRGHEEQAERKLLVVRQELADDEDDHRDETGREAAR